MLGEWVWLRFIDRLRIMFLEMKKSAIEEREKVLLRFCEERMKRNLRKLTKQR
jgi:hypothetical protein